MVALFADLPEAVENTVEIARRCAFRPKKRKPILPRFADDEVEELRRQAREGLDGAARGHPALGDRSRPTASGWSSSSASSRAWASPATS